MFDRFEQLLKQVIGLDAASIGTTAIERAVLARTQARELSDLSAYWSLVSSNSDELQELIEAVVVPETWFFRDRPAFTALTGLALEFSRNRASERLHILSLPCSTGEEPYSIAMTLLEAGLETTNLEIQGIDISAQALARAERGFYGRNSFRGADLSFRDHWFAPVPNGFEISGTLRSNVRFRRANLFDAHFPFVSGSCDIIFCRNLLIYFDRPTQIQALRRLASLLRTNGVLFVGPSETSLLIDQGFESARIPLAFAFRKRPALRGPASTAARQSAPSHAPPMPRRSPPAAVSTVPSPIHRSVGAPPVLKAVAPPPQTEGIDAIRRLADLGQLDEAAQRCEAHLREHGASAEPLYLLGLIRDARKQRALAVDAYRKALYLEPEHRGALEHLAALLRAEGNVRGALILGERLHRLERNS